MNIRKRLKDSATVELQSMVEQLERRAIELVSDQPIEPKELMRLASSDRNKVLMRKLTSKMAQQAEIEMVAEYEKTREMY